MTSTMSPADPHPVLAEHTTLRLGGPCRRIERLDRVADLVGRLRELDARGEPVLVLGGGSNLVVGDAGFDGVVLKVTAAAVAMERVGDRVRVRAEAGASWDELVARLVGEGLAGVEALSGIPGSVGATPMQNVGAYGQEVSDVIETVHVFDRTRGEVVAVPAAECGFAYRESRFRGKSDRIVLSVDFLLRPSPEGEPVRYLELARALSIPAGATAPLARVRDTVLTLRRGKGMVLDPLDAETRSAGSFFTNPIVMPKVADAVDVAAGVAGPRFAGPEGRVKLAAAWLIERAGFTKGQRFGRVHIGARHALALVTDPGATTSELLVAARAIQEGVRQRFGVTLSPEPIFIGCSL